MSVPTDVTVGLEYKAGRPLPDAAQRPEQHQGRSRRFNHVEGNYATSVFIPGQQDPGVQCCATGRAVNIAGEAAGRSALVMGIFRFGPASHVCSYTSMRPG